VDYLYKALERETNVASDEPETRVPPALERLGNHALRLDAAPALSDTKRPAERAALPQEEQRPYPDILSSSAAVQQTPELFYALAATKMTKDRILALEQIRVLRSRIMELARVRGLRTLLVTSSVAEEGKTITSINLALALSHVQGVRVLLVDADLRKPGIARVLGIEPAGNLLNYMKSEISLETAMRHLNAQLSFMPSEKTHSSVELLHSAEMKEFIRAARESYDLVIVDSPPLYSIADAQILANYVDAVMLCVRAGQTSMDLVAECAGMVSAKLIGAVLVGGERQPHGYYSYSYSQDGMVKDKK
jgi:protein-tyrosine kinase